MRWVVPIFLLVASVGCEKPAANTTDPKAAGPVVSGDGPDLTYVEILEKLKAGGLPKAKMSPTKYGQMYALEPNEQTNFVDFEDVFRQGGSWKNLDQPVAICDKLASAKAAKESAGRHESGAWAWGRYCWTGSDDTLAKVKKALAK